MLRHQPLTPFPNKLGSPKNDSVTTTSSIQPNSRSRFTLQSPNLRIAASSSLILCSTMLLYTELQASGAESKAQPCNPTSAAKSADPSCQPPAQPPANVAPEATLIQQWSNALQRGTKDNELPKEVETTYSELLNQAQSAASRDQLTAAVDTVAGIPKNSQHYEMAQQLEEGWSKELMRQATNQFRQAEVTTAIAMIDKIPETSQWHGRGIEIKQQWKQQAKLFTQARSAKSAKDWQGTINAIKEMEGTPLYNSLPVQELLQQAMINRYEPDPDLLQLAIEDAPTLPVLPQSEAIKTISASAP